MLEDRMNAAIDACYDAVLRPEGWSDALQSVAAAAGATCAMFLPKDPGPAELKSSHEYKGLLEEYLRKGWFQGHYRAQRGWPICARKTVIVEHDLATDEERRKLRHYNELYLRWGYPWFAAVGFTVEGAQWCMPLLRTSKQGYFTHDDARELAVLSPHLRRMLHLSETFAVAQASSGIELLERVGKAALLLGRDGRIIVGNARSREIILRSAQSLRLRDGRLVSSHPDSNRRLERLLAGDAGAAAGLPQLLPIAIEREGLRPLLVEAVSLRSLLSLVSPKAGKILLLTDPEERNVLPATSVGAMYSLTPSETALANLLADGREIDRCADELGITVGTARQRLKSLLAKTDTHRQATLVTLLGKLSR